MNIKYAYVKKQLYANDIYEESGQNFCADY